MKANKIKAKAEEQDDEEEEEEEFFSKAESDEEKEEDAEFPEEEEDEESAEFPPEEEDEEEEEAKAEMMEEEEEEEEEKAVKPRGLLGQMVAALGFQKKAQKADFNAVSEAAALKARCDKLEAEKAEQIANAKREREARAVAEVNSFMATVSGRLTKRAGKKFSAMLATAKAGGFISSSDLEDFAATLPELDKVLGGKKLPKADTSKADEVVDALADADAIRHRKVKALMAEKGIEYIHAHSLVIAAERKAANASA